MRLPAPKALAAFLTFQFLCGQAHEFAHHLAARWICGAWGSMTFDYFHLPPSADGNPLVRWSTFAGPALTYGLLLLSAGWMGRRRAPETRAFGLLLCFANLPFGRLGSVLTGHGDEIVLAKAWMGGPFAWPLVAALALALTLPALLRAWDTLPSRHRGWSFAGLLFLPLVADVLLKRLTLAPLLARMPGEALFGLPPFLLAVDCVFLLAALLVLPPWRVRFGAEGRPA